MKPARSPLKISPLGSGGEAEWARFLASSDNGTLFHDLDFLAYHPPSRFRFEHLLARRGDDIVALVAGGLAGPASAAVFTSPLGASVGGPVLAPGLPAHDALELVEALQAYARLRRWAGIELTLPPAAYSRQPSDTLDFALFCHGFELRHRWLCHMAPLTPGLPGAYKSLFRNTASNLVRAGRRKGITVVQGGEEQLEGFLTVFRETYTRHGAAPTHSPEEIADLLRRLPQRVRLYIATRDNVPLAGLLVMLLNAKVANTFYICSSTARARENGTVVAVAALLDDLAAQGYSWLDFGPSARDGNFDRGIAFFKEGLGGIGHCRNRWIWSADGGGESSD